MIGEADYSLRIQNCIVNMDKERLTRLIREMIHKGMDLNKALDAMEKGMRIVGEKYAKKEYFIPEVLLA
ncbi:MAG: B12-binding domain-containing protein, partial [Candidatus Bathyarchaeia archaeon]